MGSGVSIIEALVSDAANGWRLDRALADAVPTLSRERLKALIASGAVSDRSGALLRDPARKAIAGDVITVAVPAPKPAHNEAQDIPLDIAFEDEHLIVIDKPAGLVVHPAAGNLDGTLVNALLHHCGGSLSGIGGDVGGVVNPRHAMSSAEQYSAFLVGRAKFPVDMRRDPYRPQNAHQRGT